MRFPTGSKKAVSRLSTRSLKNSKLRNMVAITAIALTTILFTSVFTIGLGMKASMEETTFRMVGGYAHGGFKNLTEEQYAKLKEHPLIKEEGISQLVDIAQNEELVKHQTEIRYMDKNTAKWMYSEVEVGREPQTIDEVAVPTYVLDALGLPHEVGVQVPLSFAVAGEVRTQVFTLVGYWEMAKGVSVGHARVSRTFIEQVLRIATEEEKEVGLGKIFMDVMVKNPTNIEKSIYTIAEESGFIPDGIGDTGINVGVNWAYMNAQGMGPDPMAVIAVIGACLLIMFTGYLIIYNVFQISVMADIRHYGLLKTIGTTPKQIKYMVKKQASYLSAVGIPLGLILGYLLGNALLPMIMSTTTVTVSQHSTHPIIFIGSALFALVTVFISCYKPGNIAARISPIEASKYSEVTKSRLQERKVSKNNVLHMAYRNMTRNKKKTVIVVLSMSLSLVILNSVYTYTQGFDMDKYLSKNVVSDFTLGHAHYFNVNYGFENSEDQLSPTYKEMVGGLDGVESVSSVYYEVNLPTEIIKDKLVQLYGIDDGVLDKLEVIEGAIDLEKFRTGDYILEIVWVDDYGRTINETIDYEVGEKVELQGPIEGQGIKTYEVMATVTMPGNITARLSWQDAVEFILSTENFKEYVVEPLEMIALVEVEDDAEKAIEGVLAEYTSHIEHTMGYQSKKSYEDEFEGMRAMFFNVGIVASFVIGMIGIVNFINAMMTSILARRGEFAILQSIGMTTKQLRKMLVIEGALYAGMTAIVSFVLGILVSVCVVKPLGQNLWFFTYQFEILPLLIVIPFLIALGIFTPFSIYKVIGKETIVQRLRKID